MLKMKEMYKTSLKVNISVQYFIIQKERQNYFLT